MTTDDPTYSLALSDQEIERYRFMAALARANEGERWTAAGIVAGAAVADIGCGPGLPLLELADVVGPTGSVVGVDRGEQEVATANALIAGAGITHASVHRGDAWNTGIAPGSVDVVNIRHVLAHNTAEHQLDILRHALDLLRPGGALYLVDVDLSGGRYDPPNPDIADLNEHYLAHLRATGRDGQLGPRLGSLAREAGFEAIQRSADVSVPPPAALATVRPPAWAARQAMQESGHATDDDIARWDRALADIAEHAATGNYAFFMPTYVVIARKPGTNLS